VARLKEQGFRRIGLFDWTEPFLNRNIEDYVRIAKRAGFYATLSSTLSLPRIANLEDTLAAGLDLLTVSTSGIDQATYEINHVGGVLDYVTRNLELVRDIVSRRALRLQVDLRFLKFDYNAHQQSQLHDYAQRMGFQFEVLDGVGHPKWGWLKEHTNERYIREAEAAAGKPSPEDEGKACELMFNQMVIDCLGDVYLCCAMPNFPSLRLGKFLEMTGDEILAAKFHHPFCRACIMPRRDRTADEERRLQKALSAINAAQAGHRDEPLCLPPSF
jgi:MoaA/NifB/PqqE/SkfB family radical SAM enzyme